MGDWCTNRSFSFRLRWVVLSSQGRHNMLLQASPEAGRTMDQSTVISIKVISIECVWITHNMTHTWFKHTIPYLLWHPPSSFNLSFYLISIHSSIHHPRTYLFLLIFPSSLLSRNLLHLAAHSLLVARIRYVFVECQTRIDITLELFQHLLAVLGESMRLPESLFAILLCLIQSPILGGAGRLERRGWPLG